MIRLLVIDDHPVVREGLAAVLEDQPDLTVAGTAPSAEQGLLRALHLHPDVVLLDLEMPEGGGVEAIPALIEAGARVVVFTAYLTDEHLFGAIRAGAKGYLLKGAPLEEIAHCIRVVHSGQSHLDPRATARVMAGLGRPSQATIALTVREIEVLRLVVDGLSNKQIAHSLSIAERTVKFHITSIFQKLPAENRAQAVALALQRRLLT
jgi:DNA-binding NarL/FixJ family response regulator